MTKEFAVLLAGYYGFGNLGDELLAQSLVGLLEKAGVARKRVAILSASPRRTSEELDIAAFDRWKFMEVCGAIKRSQTLLFGGGGLFQDSTSARSCLYYWWLSAAARFYRVVPWAVGQSIGPLNRPATAFLAKNAFASCAYRGVRDIGSLEQLRAWGLDGVLSPDLVMGLRTARRAGGGGVLLLNLRPGYDRMAEDAARKAQKYAEDNGLSIRGMAFSAGDAEVLRYFESRDILKMDGLIIAENLGDFENAVADCDCGIGMRLHFQILSLLSGIPIAAVPYDPKVNSLSLRYNIPIITEDQAVIEFSEAWGDSRINAAAENLFTVLRDGVRNVLGEA